MKLVGRILTSDPAISWAISLSTLFAWADWFDRLQYHYPRLTPSYEHLFPLTAAAVVIAQLYFKLRGKDE